MLFLLAAVLTAVLCVFGLPNALFLVIPYSVLKRVVVP